MKHLLVIRNSAMGDVALALPVFSAALDAYPDLKITMLSHKNYSPFFEDLPRFTFFPVDFKKQYRGLAGILSLIEDLKEAGPYDAVLDLHAVIRSWIISARFKAGGTAVFSIDKGRAAKKALTRKYFKIFKRLKPSYERYADVFLRAGFPVKLGLGPWIHSRPFPYAFFREKLLYPKNKIWIGYAPYARHIWKIWPEKKTEELVMELALNGFVVLLFGGGKEEASKLEAMAGLNPNIYSVAGSLTLNEELALMEKLDLMVSMDSSNMHMAALTGTPVVSIWGQTHSNSGFEPLGANIGFKAEIDPKVLTCRPCSVFGNKTCFRGDFACMNWIAVRDVKSKIKEALQEKSKHEF